jgi:membrane-bound lytic murein transglycosylase MltF
MMLYGSMNVEARSLEEIRKTHEIRMCVAGSSYELYTAMGMAFVEHIGVHPKVRRLDSWDQQFHNENGITIKEESYTPALLASGECDFYPNDLVIHEWRKKKLDFVILFRTHMTVVVHRDNQSRFTTEAELKGKTAAIQKGTTYHTWMEEKNTTDFADNPIRIRFMTTDESMKAVDTKAVDFTIIGADGALNWTRNKVKDSVVAFPVGTVTEVGWAFRKDDQDLQEAVRQFFEMQRKVGSQFDNIWQEKVGIALSEFTLFMTNFLNK